MSQSEPKKLTIKEWVHFISSEEMPVFSHTAHQIAEASNVADTSITDLTHHILQDSSMTARILRLANSVYYNPSGSEVGTVSRAIVYLGYDVVRSMALTIAIIEPMLTGLKQEYVLREMARAFHAAIQAKSIAQQREIDDVEEVFIAALLFRLGHMAFWCFPKSFAVPMDDAYQEWDDEQKAETEVLGFPLYHLTSALNDEWHLSKLLGITLKGLDKDNKQSIDLEQAYELVHAVEDGWGDFKVKDTITSISERISLSYEETEEMVKKNAYEAARTAEEYGIKAASDLIPLPRLDETLEVETREFETSGPDYKLQMTILRELTTMLHERVDLNAILSTIIEGIFRGLGMERTVLAFINQDLQLQAKYVLGDDKNKLKKSFSFAISNRDEDLFSYLLKSREAFWSNPQTRKPKANLFTKPIKKSLGTLDFFAMPIWIGETGKGLIYADNKLSGSELTAAQFQTFTHFSEYATIAFDLLSRHR